MDDFSCQKSIFLHIFLQYFTKNRLFETKNRPQLLYGCEFTPRPIYPQNGLGKQFLKIYSIPRNIDHDKSKKPKNNFFRFRILSDFQIVPLVFFGGGETFRIQHCDSSGEHNVIYVKILEQKGPGW